VTFKKKFRYDSKHPRRAVLCSHTLCAVEHRELALAMELQTSVNRRGNEIHMTDVMHALSSPQIVRCNSDIYL
jgi:hypothetical protein